MADNGQILYARHAYTHFIKMVGSVRHVISTGLDTLIERLRKEDEIDEVVIDLTEADYLDSTNLGLLAKITSLMLEKFRRRATIVSSNPDINIVLRSMGFDQAFLMLESMPETPEDLSSLSSLGESERSQAKMILEAHRALMDMNDDNKAAFADVVRYLEMEQ